VFYAFLLIVGVAGIGLYLLVILREVPGAKEERLGTLEDLPPDVGQWKADDDSSDGKAAFERGERRELRYWNDEQGGRLLLQVRYRDAESGKILRAEPDEVVKRKRRRS
jgi:hypothetical protein